MATVTSHTVPNTVKAAAGVLLLYGIAELVNALYNPVYQPALAQALAVCAGMALLAWGLMRGARWAWWIAVLLSSFCLITGTAALLLLISPMSGDRVPSGNLVPWFVGSAIALAVAIGLLLLPASRAAFRRPAAAHMTSKAHGLLLFGGFVVAGMVIGLVGGYFLYLAIVVIWGVGTAGPLLMAMDPLVSPDSFVSLAVIGGAIGLWLGSRKVPTPGKTAYLLAIILILSFPTWQQARRRTIRLTPEAVAKATLSSSSFHSAGLTLGKPRVLGDDRQFPVKHGDTVVGHVVARRFGKVMWRSGGASYSLPDKE
jgi:hypothetical protein